MQPKFQFTVANVLRATAWIASSCFAWKILLDGPVPSFLPGCESFQFCFFFFLVVFAPMFAIAALFGRTLQAIPIILCVAIALLVFATLFANV